MHCHRREIELQFRAFCIYGLLHLAAHKAFYHHGEPLRGDMTQLRKF
ncbi:hypothetical protein EDWATA_00016 [Edwardsiella tarda ATCC 23685]|uniref:Uncharacterized protein n=1 Tax=Edwardsiella tarda ATCC 23685 TaxID=500638 RepID=D4F001_EDWTA|nr:hypothetical protein EDWATA_00016 [Edwardsiella tarda ATCC 23685]